MEIQNYYSKNVLNSQKPNNENLINKYIKKI